jgi:nucleoside-diphosphate-sugar epimerase
MKKLLVLGGTGFLGYYTVLDALKKGYDVTTLGIDDIKLDGWFPKEVHVRVANVFTATEEELVELMTGYDFMVYNIGPDDRVTPKAPAYEFFHVRLVDYCAKCFRAAEKAGIKKAVIFNSYFAYFDRVHPELKLAEHNPYIKARVEQAALLLEQKKNMEVVILELPYIFGAMPERMPLWKETLLDRFCNGQKVIFFPKGSTTMIAVQHIGEAAIGALEYGKDGERYPIGDENHTFNWMLDNMMIGIMGKKRKIINPSGRICAWGAKMTVGRKDKKAGLESGLDYGRLMTDIMSKDLVVEPDVIDKIDNELHVGRGGLEESIKVMVKRCYKDGEFK